MAQNKPEKGYEQDLVALLDENKREVIPSGDEANFTLDDYRLDSKNQKKYNYLYQLIAANPQSLEPVADKTAMLSFSGDPKTYPNREVTAHDRAVMKTSLDFYKHLTACPTSKLITGFTTALKEAQGKSSVDNIEKVIADYFNSTKSFRGMTLASYNMASTYICSYAWVWGLGENEEPGRKYWVYASNGPEAKRGDAASAVATITFEYTPPTSNGARPDDHNSGYVITLTPQGSGSPTKLTHAQGQFVDDTNKDIPNVCLQGIFAPKSQYTQKPNDKGLWPVLTGTYNGVKVIAVSQAPPDAGWLKNLTGKTFDEWVDLFNRYTGLLMGIHFLGSMGWALVQKIRNRSANEKGGKKLTSEEIEQSREEAKQTGQEDLAQQHERAARFGDTDIEIPDESEIESMTNQTRAASSQLLRDAAADTTHGSIEEYGAQLDKLSEIGVTPKMQDAYSTLEEMSKAVDVAQQPDEFARIRENLNEVRTSITESVNDINPSSEVREQITRSNEAIEEYEAASEESIKESESVNEGEDPTLPDEVIEAA